MNAAVRNTFRFERWFYISCATMVVVVTLAGFSVDLELLEDMSGISLLVRFHAAVMFTWVCLFVVQILLVAMGRTQWHRRLGIFGGILAVLLVCIGVITTVTAAQLGGDHLPPGIPINYFLAASFELLILFAVFVSAGIAWRRRSDFQTPDVARDSATARRRVGTLYRCVYRLGDRPGHRSQFPGSWLHRNRHDLASTTAPGVRRGRRSNSCWKLPDSHDRSHG